MFSHQVVENFAPSWQDVLFSDTMWALILELVTFLIRVISTDSHGTPDNQKSLHQRQWEENYIRSHIQEQARAQPQAPWPWDQSQLWRSMEARGDKIKFLCTDRQTDGSLSTVSIASPPQTLQIWAPCSQSMLLSHKQSVPFCCSIPRTCHF